MKKAVKIVRNVLCGIVAFIALVLVCMNIGKHIVYREFYSIKKKVAPNPGLNSRYVPQGCTYDEDHDRFITTGYMADDTASRIYTIQNKTNKIRYYTLLSGAKEFNGHTGGLQYDNGLLYLANEGVGLYVFNASQLERSGSIPEIGSPKKINNHSSFVYVDSEYVYVGEFHHAPKYVCEHPVTYGEITNHAILSKYKKGEFDKPVAVYSLPDEVQGFAITPAGRIVLSTSWALNSSKFYIYDSKDVIDTGKEFDGAKLYFLGEPTKLLKGPAMSEDLDIYDGKAVTFSELACDKYILGKLFFYYDTYTLDIDSLF